MLKKAQPLKMQQMKDSWSKFKTTWRGSARKHGAPPPTLGELENRYLKEVLYEGIWYAEQAQDAEKLRAMLEWRSMFRPAADPPWVDEAREFLQRYDAQNGRQA